MIRDRVSTIAIIAGLMAIIFAVLLLFLPPSYILLGAIIEQASGRSYPEFLQENIFYPVNMTGSGTVHRPFDTAEIT